jgi:AcrR family transcriptional regulator
MPRPRGRPPNPRTRSAILAAAHELLETGGITGVTMEGIAERARVGKPTIYRYWPNAQAVAMAALMASDASAPHIARTRSALADLRRQLRTVAAVFDTRMGRNVATMIASASTETELSKIFRNHFILARREEGRALLLRAIEANEVRADLELDAALDMIYGSVFYRLLMGHARLDARFTDAVLDLAMAGLKRRRQGTHDAPQLPRRIHHRLRQR